jgi:hypothetical protein
VTTAWTLEHGRVGVRIRPGEGEWIEFVVPASGSKVEWSRKLRPGTRPMPGEGNPLFSPPSQDPPEGDYRHERIEGEDGTFLGWLSTRESP